MTEFAPELREEYEAEGYVYPAYRDRCFADVTDSALSLLSSDFDRNIPDDAFGDLSEGVENVVLLVVDGFGLDQWMRLRGELPLLDAFETDGTVTPLTSTYPSETAAAITTLHTGLLPAEHGLLGWDQYLESIDEAVQTLPFLLGDGTQVRDEYPLADPRELFEGEAIYGAAEAAEIDAHVTQPEHIAGSASSELTTDGAETHGYWNVADMLVTLRDIVEGDGQTHVTAYVPNVDTISHRTGTEAERYDAQVRMVTEAFRSGFLDGLNRETAAETAVLLTADHGHTNVEGGLAVDLSVPEVQDCLARDAHGEVIPPVGGPRNVQLHVEDGQLEEIREHIETEANGDVLTFTEAEYRDRGLFGSNHAEPSETFDRRAPDLLAVHRDSPIWNEPNPFVGVHGGMTPEEMLVPLATARASDLQD